MAKTDESKNWPLPKPEIQVQIADSITVLQAKVKEAGITSTRDEIVFAIAFAAGLIGLPRQESYSWLRFITEELDRREVVNG